MVIFLPGCRVMVSESYDQQEVEKTMMYYSTPLVKESDFPFNFYLLDLPQNHSGLWLHSLVDLWMANMPGGLWANWVVRPDPYLTLSPGSQSRTGTKRRCSFKADESIKLNPRANKQEVELFLQH